MKRLSNISCDLCPTQKIGAFCDLDGRQRQSLDSSKTCNIYSKGQILFYEGNRPHGIFCVASGKVKLIKSDADGNQKIVSIADAGALLGYGAALIDQAYHTTAEVIEDAQVCFIDADTFEGVLKSSPKTAAILLSRLAEEVRQSQANEMSLVHKNVRERLAELLLILKRRYGQTKGDEIAINLSLSRQEIAELIGTTQESTIRLLSEFKKDGMIRVDRRHISILDEESLVRTANLS